MFWAYVFFVLAKSMSAAIHGNETCPVTNYITNKTTPILNQKIWDQRWVAKRAFIWSEDKQFYVAIDLESHKIIKSCFGKSNEKEDIATSTFSIPWSSPDNQETLWSQMHFKWDQKQLMFWMLPTQKINATKEKWLFDRMQFYQLGFNTLLAEWKQSHFFIQILYDQF